MSFKGRFFTVLTFAGAAVFACLYQSKAANADYDRAFLKRAKFFCYDVYGGASNAAEVKPRMGTLEKILVRNRASSFKHYGTNVGNLGRLKYYYGMVPMDRQTYGKWSRVYLGIQKIYVFAGSKCGSSMSTSLDGLMQMQCRGPSCRLPSGWQRMIVRSTDDPL